MAHDTRIGGKNLSVRFRVVAQSQNQQLFLQGRPNHSRKERQLSTVGGKRRRADLDVRSFGTRYDCRFSAVDRYALDFGMLSVYEVDPLPIRRASWIDVASSIRQTLLVCSIAVQSPDVCASSFVILPGKDKTAVGT